MEGRMDPTPALGFPSSFPLLWKTKESGAPNPPRAFFPAFSELSKGVGAAAAPGQCPRVLPAGASSRGDTIPSRSIPGTRLSHGFFPAKKCHLDSCFSIQVGDAAFPSFSRCHPRAGTVGCVEFRSIPPQRSFSPKSCCIPLISYFSGISGAGSAWEHPAFPREYPIPDSGFGSFSQP